MRSGITSIAILLVPGVGQVLQGRRALGVSFLISFAILVAIGLLSRENEWLWFLKMMYAGAFGALYWMSGADYSRRHEQFQQRAKGNAPDSIAT